MRASRAARGLRARQPGPSDHHDIIRQAIGRIAERIDATNIARSLVPKTFTVPELRHVHAIVGGKAQDPGNFRRKFERMVEDGIVEQAPGKRITASKAGVRDPLDDNTRLDRSNAGTSHREDRPSSR